MSPQYLTVTELAYKLIADLESLMEMLSPSDQRIVKGFCDYILQQRVPIANTTNLLPLEVALVLIQVEEHKRNHHEIAELHSRLQELQDEIESLKNPSNEEI
jgi:hypothetical protein